MMSPQKQYSLCGEVEDDSAEDSEADHDGPIVRSAGAVCVAGAWALSGATNFLAPQLQCYHQ
jgi:hypothetical protein